MLLKLYNNLFESVSICRRRRVPVLHLKVSITDSGEGLVQLNVKKEKFERCVKMIIVVGCGAWLAL